MYSQQPRPEEAMASYYNVDLHVQPAAEYIGIGGDLQCWLIVRVTDENNAPVANLKQDNFTAYENLAPGVSAGSFRKLDIASYASFLEVHAKDPHVDLPGVYVLSIDTFQRRTQSYVFAVAVATGVMHGTGGVRGQGLATLVTGPLPTESPG
jgi:hypothetical protein